MADLNKRKTEFGGERGEIVQTQNRQKLKGKMKKEKKCRVLKRHFTKYKAWKIFKIS